MNRQALDNVTDVIRQAGAKPDTLVTNPLRTGTLHIVQVLRVVYDTAGVGILDVHANRQPDR